MRLGRYTRSAAAMSILVAVASMVAAAGVATVLAADQNRVAEDQMGYRSELVTEAVSTETRRYVDTLRTAAAATAVVETLTAARFAQIAEPLRKMGLAGATSLAFMAPAGDSQVAEVQAQWRARGATGLVLSPVGTGREHVFSIISEPLDGGPPAVVGTDVTQLSAPDQALTEARTTGEVTASYTYQLLRDRDLPPERRQLAFILTAPVFEAPAADGSRAFRGWVLMGLRGQDFIGMTLKRISQNLLDVTLRAGTAEGTQVAVATVAATVSGTRDLRREVAVPVAQRQWHLDILAPSDQLPGASTAFPVTMGIAGAALGLLVAALVYVLATGRTRARNQVRQATAQLLDAEAAARSQASLLEAVLNGISDGVAVIDVNGEFLLHNPAANRMLGVEANVARPDDWQAHYGIFRPDGTTPFPAEDQPLVRALAGESTDGVEMVIRNAGQPDGVRLAVSGRPLAPGDGHAGAVALLHDVTVQRAQEAELTAFAGMVAHELRTPLTLVAGYAEVLTETVEAGDPDPAALRTPLAHITTGARRMGHLIHDLLAYVTARDAPLNITDVDLGFVAADVVTLLLGARSRPAADAVPVIRIGPLPTVRADPSLARQLLDNLIGNAIKYTRPGEAARVDVSARTDQPGWVRIEVADRGIGIPQGQHEAIFADFHRAHADGPYTGTGLGLAICQHIIDRHGGTITVADNPGGGSRFSFTLPLGEAGRA